MKKNKLIITGFILWFLTSQAHATWSIVILDPETKNIGMAGASCTHNVFGIAKYITDKGVVIAQAVSERKAWIKAVNMLMEDKHPIQIIDSITNPNFDPDFALRQYAIVSFKHFDNPVTFSGDSIANYKRNAYTAPGISVQGNSLASEKVLKEVFKAVLKAQKDGKSMEEMLLIALEVGSKYGGDIRCGDQTATSCFIQIGKPDDDRSSAYLDLRIVGTPKGELNPIAILREEYEQIKYNIASNKGTRILIVPKENK